MARVAIARARAFDYGLAADRRERSGVRDYCLISARPWRDGHRRERCLSSDWVLQVLQVLR